MTVQTVGKGGGGLSLSGWMDCSMRRALDSRARPEAKVEEVLAMTLERRPKEATHWSTRLMAKATGLAGVRLAAASC
jgi:hypothetical protein